MYLFKEYLAQRLREAEEGIPPVPPGVDPEYWAFKSWRINWFNSPEGKAYAAQQQQQQPKAPVARALGPALTKRPSMPLERIEGELKSYLGMQESGLLKKVPNLLVVKAVQDKINNGQIIVHGNGGKARRQGAGIHFYSSPEGIVFVNNTPGSRPF